MIQRRNKRHDVISEAEEGKIKESGAEWSFSRENEECL